MATGGFGNETDEMLRRFAAQTGVTFPIVRDNAGSYGQFASGCTGCASASPFPVDAVVGPDGRVVYIKLEYDAEELRAAVEAALPASVP